MLKPMPKEKHKSHLYNTRCIFRQASWGCTYNLMPTSTSDDKTPLSEYSSSPEIKGTHSPLGSHSFGSYFPSYSWQINFPWCNNSTWCGLYLWLTRERTPIRSVTRWKFSILGWPQVLPQLVQLWVISSPGGRVLSDVRNNIGHFLTISSLTSFTHLPHPPVSKALCLLTLHMQEAIAKQANTFLSG